MRSIDALRTTAMLTALLLAVAGCQKQPAPTSDAGSESPPATARDDASPRPANRDPSADGARPDVPSTEMPERDTTPVDSKIVRVTLSNEGDTEKNSLGMPKTSFGPQDTVYAEVQSQGTASEYTVYAKWIGADGAVLADYGIKVNEPGMTRTVISLSKPDGWPTGENRIELAINGSVQQTVPFQVQ